MICDLHASQSWETIFAVYILLAPRLMSYKQTEFKTILLLIILLLFFEYLLLSMQ